MGTHQNKGGKWAAGRGITRSGMRESCESGRMRNIKFFNDFFGPLFKQTIKKQITEEY